MMDAKKLAAALREAVRVGDDWRDALRSVAIRLEAPVPTTATPDAVAKLRKIAAEYSAAGSERAAGYINSAADEVAEMAPAVHWIGPFAHHGGECPVPPETLVATGTSDGSSTDLDDAVTANCHRWTHRGDGSDIVAFRYAAHNPEGWLERPEGWVPPDEAWPLEHKRRADTPAQRNGQVGNRELRDYEWKGVTHIRLLPRRVAVSPLPTERSGLDALIQAARECGPMSDDEVLAQRASYVRGEMGIGSDRDEAAYRAEMKSYTRDVVREALGRALDCHPGGAARAHINDALAALDDAPPLPPHQRRSK